MLGVPGFLKQPKYILRQNTKVDIKQFLKHSKHFPALLPGLVLCTHNFGVMSTFFILKSNNLVKVLLFIGEVRTYWLVGWTLNHAEEKLPCIFNF